MPPKTEEDMQELALVHGDDDIRMPSSPCSSYSYSALCTSSLKRTDSCCFSFVELREQPSLLMSEDKDNVTEAFESSLGYLSLRVEELSARTVKAVQCLKKEDDSPVLKACTMSLHSRVPLLLKQATLLIHQLKRQSLENEESEQARIIMGRWRSNFALVRLVQYLDLIESAMQNPPREMLDQRLLEILQKCPSIAGSEQAFFRVSPWLAKSLAFDLPIGQSASTHLLASAAGDGGGGKNHHQLALQVEVEPIFEIHAADIVAGKLENLRIGACSVVIESCKHKATPFSAGAGMIGECIIRVHLTPLQVQQEEENKKQSVSGVAASRNNMWGGGGGKEPEQKQLVIKEARAVQVNAYPPKPKANVDLYTSNLHGDAGITVTMIVKTSVTETLAEIPKLHIELFLAPLSVVKKSTSTL